MKMDWVGYVERCLSEKWCLASFKDKHDTYLEQRYKVVGDEENENTSNENE